MTLMYKTIKFPSQVTTYGPLCTCVWDEITYPFPNYRDNGHIVEDC